MQGLVESGLGEILNTEQLRAQMRSCTLIAPSVRRSDKSTHLSVSVVRNFALYYTPVRTRSMHGQPLNEF